MTLKAKNPRNSKPNQAKIAKVLKAIPGSSGIISEIQRRTGVDWLTIKGYTESIPEVRQAYEAETETVLDKAESKLFEAIEAGDLQAVKYLLSTKGKVRGYTERRELTGADGDAVTVKFVWEDGNGDD